LLARSWVSKRFPGPGGPRGLAGLLLGFGEREAKEVVRAGAFEGLSGEIARERAWRHREEKVENACGRRLT
jgi:hypothetical protein